MHTHVPTTRTHAITSTSILQHKGTHTHADAFANKLYKKKYGRGHNFKTPTTARKTRQHKKKKTRLNFKFTHCIYMLNEITKYINKQNIDEKVSCYKERESGF